jgi:DNA processing protein
MIMQDSLSLEGLANLYLLDSLKGFGPQKFKQLYESKVPIEEAIREPRLLPILGKVGEPIRDQLRADAPKRWSECLRRAEKQLKAADLTGAHIISYSHPHYPAPVYKSSNPIAVLYVRGRLEPLLSKKTVACVGSRNIRQPYSRKHAEFTKTAVQDGFVVVSGFALGADTVGHRSAVENSGETICVMPSGLDRPFPPENKSLWSSFLEENKATFVSEFPFGTGAVALNLRKRNKLIVAFAQGVLVSQSSLTGGAMNAYRFALEQKKMVSTFKGDGTDDTSGNDLIATNDKHSGTVFEIESGSISYELWLRQLSSST